MKTGAAFVGFLFSAAVGFAVGFSVGTSSNPPAEQRAEAAQNEPAKLAAAKAGNKGAEDDNDVFKVPVGESFAKGPADALVTIVEFSDFQCPFCSRANPTLAKVAEEYGDDVRVVFKHQPLPFHKDARLASKYALAAGKQGKFWPMHDKLFANAKALKEDQLKSYASELGLDQSKIDAFLESGEPEKMIQEDQALARKVGANGTPTFFINGKQLVGAQPFPAFKKVIDAEMASAKAMITKGVKKADVYAQIIKDGRSTPKPRPQRKAPPATRQNVKLEDNTPYKGGESPLVTIVEFSDYQCPFCSRVNPTIAQVQKTYGDKVQIRFRNLPLGFHKRAKPAAKAALAAHKQGKFWPMHDKLFANQKALEDADLEKYASELGLNMERFKTDLKSPEIDSWVSKDTVDAGKYGARGTPTLFVNGVPVRGAMPFASFKQVIDKEIAKAEKLIKEGVKRADVYGEILKREAGKEVALPSNKRPSAPPAPKGPVDIKLGKAPLHGKKDAPIQLVVFSDFQCPFCGRVNPTIDQVKKEYGDKVSVAFKHFPLSFHADAEPAAVASLAAHRQGKFWQMHDKLFENQRALKRADLVSYAKDLQLDVAKFEKDLDDPELKQWVKSDMAEGTKVGVRGTPATFINGMMLSGAQPFDAFKRLIEAELKKKG
ncbi:MAG: thioredoxin domain-containing protein [Myxococcota bacterium]